VHRVQAGARCLSRRDFSHPCYKARPEGCGHLVKLMDSVNQAGWPATSTKSSIAGPSGAIECIAHGVEDAQRIAVICHPHSLHGGSMDNKVVVMVERALRELGAATLRFNFRGVGESAGVFDNGIGEGQDLTTVVELARQWSPSLPLWLAGFSFGSFVAASRADALDAELLISVAPPIERFGFAELPRPQARWIVLQGETDDVVEPQAVFEYFAALQPPVELLRFADTGHFFHGKLVQMRERLIAQIRGEAASVAAETLIP